MNRLQLAELIAPVRRRHNRRVILTLAAFSIMFFGGAAIVDFGLGANRAQREFYFNFILAACFGIFAVGFWRMFSQLPKDCREFGAICPSCGSHLYSLRGSPLQLNGHCAYCGEQLLDSEREKPGGDKRQPMTVGKIVKLAMIQIIAIGAVYFVLWSLGVWP